MQVIELYESVCERLAAANPLSDGRAETDELFAVRLGLDPARRILHARGQIGPHAVEAIEEVVRRNEKGLPFAYALGSVSFAGLSFEVTPDVLIPRQDTEFLVKCATDFLRNRPPKRSNLLDLGCGSGCIGLTLAVRFPHLEVTLTDVSQPALDVARANARRLGVIERCTFLAGDWFNALKRKVRFDAVLCNPPYVTRHDDPRLEQQVREHEPSLALFLEEDPQEFYFRLGRKAVSHLNNGGLFAVEVGYDTAWPARCAIEKIHALIRGREVHDFSGLERVIWGTRK